MIMKISSKKILTSIGSVTLGAGLIALNGYMMLSKDLPEQTLTEKDSTTAVQDNCFTDGTAAMQQSELPAKVESAAIERPVSAARVTVSELTAVDLPKGNNVEKAQLDDYRMLLKIDKKKSKSEKSATSSSDTTVKVTKDGFSSFEAPYETDQTKIYDPKPEKMNLTSTRSVKNEYFTVNDIISGGTVTLNAHEMLCEIVFNEIGGDWDEEAIKAQAVAAYSFLRFNDTMGLTPEVGLKPDYTSKIEKCVSAVEGQAVFYDNKIINAVYSASTAGYSVESERIWDVYYPYLRAVVSEYDNQDPNWNLENVFTEGECRSILESSLGITLSDNVNNWFAMDDIYSGRYVGYINIDGKVRITARQMQDMFDLKSQAFTVTFDNGNVTIHTFGWGHGVGMSQWGCCYYAEHGYTYDQILRHYYLNTTIALSKESTKAVNRGKS